MGKFFVLTMLMVLGGTAPAQDPSLLKGRKAPDFTLEDISGNSVRLTHLLGKGPILINFWATWCKPCLEELTAYRKLYPIYEPKGVTMLAISIDSEKSVAKVKPFVKSRDLPFVVLLDTNSEIARRYYAHTIPFTVLIDKEGSIVFTHVGYEKGDERDVTKLIDRLLSR